MAWTTIGSTNGGTLEDLECERVLVCVAGARQSPAPALRPSSPLDHLLTVRPHQTEKRIGENRDIREGYYGHHH